MTQSKESDNWSRFREVGLFRVGVHYDTRVKVTAPDGESFEVDVLPIQIKSGENTFFTPKPYEAAKVIRLFPKEDSSCI
jgi:hypothetical protein